MNAMQVKLKIRNEWREWWKSSARRLLRERGLRSLNRVLFKSLMYANKQYRLVLSICSMRYSGYASPTTPTKVSQTVSCLVRMKSLGGDSMIHIFRSFRTRWSLQRQRRLMEHQQWYTWGNEISEQGCCAVLAKVRASLAFFKTVSTTLDGATWKKDQTFCFWWATSTAPTWLATKVIRSSVHRLLTAWPKRELCSAMRTRRLQSAFLPDNAWWQGSYQRPAAAKAGSISNRGTEPSPVNSRDTPTTPCAAENSTTWVKTRCRAGPRASPLMPA